MSEFPWAVSYPEGIPTTIEEQRPENLLEAFEQSCERFADREAFENMGKGLTYREVDEASTHFAAYLQHSLGLEPGDRIAIQMPNCLQYPVVLMGALKAGCTVVNTNPLYTAREMEYQFNDSGVKTIVILANFAHNLQKILHRTSIRQVIITELGDMLGGLKGILVNFVIRHIKKMIPSYELPHGVRFKKALSEGKKRPYRKPDIQSSHPAFLQYTGGTTGVSKGAILSHANIVAHNAMLRHWFHPLLKNKNKVLMITAIPMYHIFALTVNGIFMMSVGAKNVLITNPRDMKGFVKTLKKHPFTLITGVNTLFNGLLNEETFKTVDFSNLDMAIGGGMALQDFVVRKWEEVTRSPLAEGYGLSETSPVLCCNPLDGTHRTGSIGLPVPGTEVGIFDESGNLLPVGERGEICARGPQVMSGYWNQNNENVFFDQGWFRTGDIGMMDKDGFFTIVDRKKDMINVSGFNVFPNEIENVVADHYKVLEVAAIGVPDEKSTEVVKLFVVKSDPSLTEEELMEYCRHELTSYKQPKYIEFRDELPKSNVGKILRKKLRDEITAQD